MPMRGIGEYFSWPGAMNHTEKEEYGQGCVFNLLCQGLSSLPRQPILPIKGHTGDIN